LDDDKLRDLKESDEFFFTYLKKDVLDQHKDFKEIFSRLGSFFANPPLSISNDDTHHLLIATILILDDACLFYASQTQPDRDAALDRACSRYETSDTHHAATNDFSASSVEDSISQFTEFILARRLR